MRPITARTSTDTGHFSTQPCLLDSETEVYFQEVVGAHLGILFGHSLPWQLYPFLVRQRIIAGNFITHRTPPPQWRRIRGASPYSPADFATRFPDRPATARCWHAPARATCCCAASGPQS